ncbi:5-bromo-4-chloroindolyl phosphate hydrolysis family protein [Paracoccus sediminicola]|uniref:5-bromo-4-chloroindolyl phosphate hydrolysis family protein n=1 Tax=Paracoccus sediminicola TaxID=3017783 RepID=UPI0022F11650|nr:5-bromo-4-chloroindolyl phosphate hydrolysis family protein [Paracoccus sediminicola]WBU56889.1 5-bromo-4-chloroindolyl phosphate hydrolysis family protein [Paracoccus sediminicola]
MAKRYGGRFSPGAGDMPQPQGEPVHPLESRVKWITISASPFLLSAFWQDPFGLVTNLAGFGIVALGSVLTREGLQAEAAYDARRVARRPAWPRKLFGGVATGLGLAVGAAEPNAMFGAGLIGFAGAVLHHLSFGADPARDKGMEGIDPFQQDRVARIVDEGEEYLAGMLDAIRRTGDRRLEARVQVFAETAREMFRRVEEDPGDLTAARRYLGVYLMGARDATVKFADLYAQTSDQSAREDYEALLTDLEGNFAARTRSLIEGGRSDFDIEMQVLRDRLAREGVRPRDPTKPALENRRGHDLSDLIRETVKAGRRRD